MHCAQDEGNLRARTQARNAQHTSSIPFGKRHLGSYSDLALAPFNGDNPATEIPSLSVHFDSLLKKLLL